MNDNEDTPSAKPPRHDGRDDYHFLARDEALSLAGQLGDYVPPLPPQVPAAPRTGDFVQVIMVREGPDVQGRHEALWVEVSSVSEDVVEGTLDNQPTWVRGVAAGDRVTFARAQVVRLKSK